MRIAHIILPDATEYERKSQRADQAVLGPTHEILVTSAAEAQGSGAEVAHVYAGEALPPEPFVGFAIPYVSSAALARPRWRLRKAAAPAVTVTPENVPEVVEDRYFANLPPRSMPREGELRTVGSFGRGATRNLVEQTMARIHRFRDDVTWRELDAPPTPEDLASVDLWVDPAVEERDYDGFVAEALVVGVPVVAARTGVNAKRLEQGRTGTLVPLRDPNELTHAILASLFKAEVATSKISAAAQTVSKFRARQRIRVLLHMYETLIR
ncbi:MAG: glycosyltransferase [Acidobacteriota bacterium]